jgi:flagellar FliJ protein
MKRYQFRLATVLRLRQAEKERARAALLEANLRLKELLVERDKDASRFAALASAKDAQDLAGLLAERSDAEIAARRLAQAERRVASAAGAAAQAQIAWLAAHQRVVALERLDDRRRQEHAAAALKEEIALLDELSTARYATKDRSKAGTR